MSADEEGLFAMSAQLTSSTTREPTRQPAQESTEAAAMTSTLASTPAIGAEPASPDERHARFLLACIGEAGSPALAEAVRARGAVEVLASIRDNRTTLTGADRWRRRLELLDPAAVIASGAAVGIRFVVPGDPEWPAGVDDLAAVRSTVGGGAPIGLWLRGRQPQPPPNTAVAIVGARDATAYGVTVAADLAAGLAEAGVTVVSGGAFGIDAAAHRGALAAGGRTVAVLACGVDVAYPRAHADLLAVVAERGQLISELPPGATPTKQGFLVRNRLVAAMSTVTVVVEAAYRSGALNTAAWAQASLRVLAAVPGPVTSPLSAGCHRLLRDGGAVLVTGVDEILELVRPLGAAPEPAPRSTTAVPDRLQGLDAAARRVLEAVPARGGMGLAALAAATGDPAPALLAALGELLDRGLVQQREAGWSLSPGQRAASRH